MWATVHLSKDEDQFQRVFQNVDVESVKKIFTTMQRQIHASQKEEHYGLTELLDWKESPLKILFFAQSRKCTSNQSQK